jgi:hypothetical protein
MATCASCGKDIRDDDWTCGACGAPVAGAGTSPTGYATSYEPPPDAYTAPAVYGAPAAAPAAKRGLSRSTVTIIFVAALAVVAIIAVWFLFVRGTGVVIKLRSGDFKVTMTGKDSTGTEKTYTIPAHLAGSSLEITVDDFIKATGNAEQAAQAKVVFETLIKDFRLVFTIKDPTHLEMKVEGSPVGGSAASQASASSIVLVKVK